MRLIAGIVILIFLSLSGCKKADSSLNSTLKVNEPCLLASQLEATWIWDSTTTRLNGQVVHVFTPQALKTYTNGMTDTLVHSSSECTLTLNRDFAKLRGCSVDYSLVVHVEAMADAVIRTSWINDGKPDSTNSNATWLTMTSADNSAVIFWLKYLGDLRHDGAVIAGFLPFSGGVYLVEEITDQNLVLYFYGEKPIDPLNGFRVYFRRFHVK